LLRDNNVNYNTHNNHENLLGNVTENRGKKGKSVDEIHYIIITVSFPFWSQRPACHQKSDNDLKAFFRFDIDITIIG
jgi:hypothetical protein